MEDYKRAAIAGTPLGRLVTETEIAKVIARLCEPEFDFMIGRAIVLDGGRTLPRPTPGHRAGILTAVGNAGLQKALSCRVFRLGRATGGREGISCRTRLAGSLSNFAIDPGRLFSN
jgi:hypothetical protein